jgi:hypothetical protein
MTPEADKTSGITKALSPYYYYHNYSPHLSGPPVTGLQSPYSPVYCFAVQLLALSWRERERERESLHASDRPESCAGGITATDRGCHAGEVEWERSD